MRWDFVRLTLESTPKGHISVVTRKSIAEYFGWDTAFPEWMPYALTGPGAGVRIYPRSASPSWEYRGGQRMRICRVAQKQGNPAGQTHTFRMRGRWANRHVKQLADVAGDKFEWIELRTGKRVERSYWESMSGVS